MAFFASSEDGRPALVVRSVIVFVAVTVWWLVLYRGADLVFGAEYGRGRHVAAAVGATLGTVPLIYATRRFLDRRPWSGLGLSSIGRGWRPFLFGAACWGIPALLSAAVMISLGWAELTVRAPVPQTLSAILALLALVLLYEAFPEELIFRGYFFANLRERWPTAATVLGQAALFTAWGVLIGAAGSLDRALFFFAFSAVQGALRATTGNVWACIGFHTTFQVTTQFLAGKWDYIDLDDPDMAVIGLAFGVIPFTSTALLLWLYARKQRQS
ncbi:CPBP family intramembrane glutamic endopeptidase [Nocardia suismassiliense]|uniref:CPBP family intramembrane glutamic endopeptidase n=1 Tax=Nocardia suismassiliense TaxID=2077092 RepID=UPI001F3DB4D3|nr:CPBP family intramembrane glutamic endopeptidase [Nocardia suismassiliense]